MSTYISRLVRRDGRAVALPMAPLHRLIWDFFPDTPSGERPFIFRADIDRGRLALTVVSSRPPQAPNTAWQVAVKPYTPDLRVGDRLAFHLRLNAQVKVDGARHDPVMHYRRTHPDTEGLDRQRLAQRVTPEWLAEEAAKWGFCTDPHHLTLADYHMARFPKRAGGPKVQLAVADLHGLLTVTDPTRFVPRLHEGIGRGRSYGLGLLLVRRAAP